MSKNNMDNIVGKAGIDINAMKRAAEQGRLDEFVNKSLPDDAVNKIKSVLSDKSATEKLLSTPQAKELMKKLSGDK